MTKRASKAEADQLTAQLELLDMTVKKYFASLAEKWHLSCRASVVSGDGFGLNGTVPKGTVGILFISMEEAFGSERHVFFICQNTAGFDLVPSDKEGPFKERTSQFPTYTIHPENLTEMTRWHEKDKPLSKEDEKIPGQYRGGPDFLCAIPKMLFRALAEESYNVGSQVSREVSARHDVHLLKAKITETLDAV